MLVTQNRIKPLSFVFGLGLTAACGHASADSFVDTLTLQSFTLTGVPSFNQFRDTGTPTGTSWHVLGLPVGTQSPTGGAMYCAPTSTTDFMAFLANRGYPLLSPAAGIWQDDYRNGTAGFNTYNSITTSIANIGALMNTNATSGTGGFGMQSGAETMLDLAYPGEFTVNLTYTSPATLTSPGSLPRLRDVVQASISGSVCTIGLGWYNPVTLNGQTYYTRAGGHVLALASANNVTASNTVSLGLCDPVSSDSAFQQSTFTYWPYTGTGQIRSIVGYDQSGNPWYVNSAAVDVTNYNGAPIFDGAMEIQPLQGYTILANYFYPITPIYIPNWNHPTPTWTQSFDGTDITSMSRSPVSGELFYTTAKLGEAAYVYDTAAKRTVEMPTQVAARQIMFGSGVNPYVLYSSGAIGILNVRTGALVESVSTGSSVNQLGYDPNSNRVAAFDLSHNRYMILTADLQEGVWRTLPTINHSGGTYSFAFGKNEILYEFETGDAHVYETTTTGAESYGSISVPSAQVATAFSVDDFGRFYFSVGHRVGVTNSEGAPLSTIFNGQPAGTTLTMTRSVSNYNSTIHSTRVWNND